MIIAVLMASWVALRYFSTPILNTYHALGLVPDAFVVWIHAFVYYSDPLLFLHTRFVLILRGLVFII
jgi:hypothetical protein